MIDTAGIRRRSRYWARAVGRLCFTCLHELGLSWLTLHGPPLDARDQPRRERA